MKNLISILGLSFLLIFLTFNQIFSIPAFARKYNMSCQTCHSPFPKLKDYGNEFANNGFVLADKDAPRYYIETGDQELSLIRDIPLAFRLEGYATFKHKEKENKSDFNAPWLLKVLSGGALTKNLAYYFYFYLDEQGEITGIEDAYLMFNNLFGSEFDLYVGQFQISDPLFKRELRLTLEDYKIYKTKVGESNINLSYDRGIMLFLPLKSGTDLSFEILNGSGIGIADNEKNFDKDIYKNLFGRISQQIIDEFRLGVFGFYGKEKISNDVINKVNMFGADFTLNLGNYLEMNFQGILRSDSKPFDTSLTDFKTKGLFTELIYTPRGDESKWYLAGLFNLIESDINKVDYKSFAIHGGYLLRRNVRLVTELLYNFKEKTSKFTLGFVTAF